MQDRFKLALIQMDVKLCEKDINLEKARSMIKEAVSSGARIVVLPEVFSTGFCYEQLSAVAETSPYPTLEHLCTISQKERCVLIGSIIELIKNDTETIYYNLGFCIDRGELIGTYRKTHPFGKEQEYFSPGESIHPIKLRSYPLTIGLQICYELRFPEVSRKLSLQGADILITIAQFPNPREQQWRYMAISRAIENQTFHCACNRTGEDHATSFFGSSMIIGPYGDVLADALYEEKVILYDIDLSVAEEFRKQIPIFRDRRPGLYSMERDQVE